MTVFFWIDPNSPVTYQRMVLPAMTLRQQGYKVSWGADVQAALHRADIIFAADRPGMEFAAVAWFCQQAGLPFIMDSPNGVQNKLAADRATKVIRYDSYVHRHQLDYNPRQKSKLVIGWVGERNQDAQMINTTIKRMVREHNAEFRTVGLRHDIGLGENYRHVSKPSTYPDFYKTLGFDIAVAPYTSPPENAAYTDMLLLSYAAAGVPVVATETRGTEFVSHSFNGYVAKEEQDWRLYDWNRYLGRLVAGPEYRDKMSDRAKDMAAYRVIDRHIDQYSSLLDQYAFTRPRRSVIERFLGRKAWKQTIATVAA